MGYRDLHCLKILRTLTAKLVGGHSGLWLIASFGEIVNEKKYYRFYVHQKQLNKN